MTKGFTVEKRKIRAWRKNDNALNSYDARRKVEAARPAPMKYVTRTGWLVGENEKTYFVRIDGETHNFPKSKTEMLSDDMFSIPEWLAKAQDVL